MTETSATDVCCNDFVLSVCLCVCRLVTLQLFCVVFVICFLVFFVFLFFLQPDDYCLGHVGVPIDNGEVRLIDAPECDYLTTDKPYPHGEIQIRDMSLMSGKFLFSVRKF